MICKNDSDIFIIDPVTVTRTSKVLGGSESYFTYYITLFINQRKLNASQRYSIQLCDIYFVLGEPRGEPVKKSSDHDQKLINH
jgi:hypothetical protein